MSNIQQKIYNKILQYTQKFPFLHRYLTNLFRDGNIRELTKGSGISFVFKVISLPLGLATSLVISRGFGADAIGLYGLITTVVAIVSTLALWGVGAAMPRLLGQASATQSGEESSIYRSSLHIIFFTSMVFAVLLFLTAKYISLHIFHEPDLFLPLRVLSFFLFSIVWGKLNIQFLVASKKIFHADLIGKLFRPGMFVILTILVFYLLRDVAKADFLPIWCYLISEILVVVYSLYILRKHKYIALRGSHISRRKIIQISSPMVLTAMAGFIISYSDILMLGWLGTTEDVGVYKVVLSLAGMVPVLTSIINPVLAPLFSELFRGKKLGELQKIARLVIRIVSLAGFSIGVLYAIGGPFILSLFGEEFPIAHIPLLIVTVGQFISTCAGSVGLYLNATGKEKMVRNIYFISAIVNIVLNYLLIPRFGILGAAIGFSIGLGLVNILLTSYVRTHDRVKLFLH